MDFFIVLISLIFLVIMAALSLPFLRKEPEQISKSRIGADDSHKLLKKITLGEEKIKNLEIELARIKALLAQAEEKEKVILKERSEILFDAQEYEKSRKEQQALKKELTGREDALEKEISLRRGQMQELTQLKEDNEALKKRVVSAEDAFRRAEAGIQGLSKELQLAQTTLAEQKKIIAGHVENKTEGQWVSRIEFEKKEKELKEKEDIIQRRIRPPQ